MGAVGLWATPFYQGKLDNAQELKDAFLPFVTNDYMRKTFRLSECETSMKCPDNEQLPWDLFIQSVEPHINTFFTDLDPKTPFDINFEDCWMNGYNENVFQEVHDHSFRNVNWSTVYYLDLPEQENDVSGKTVFENRYGSDVKKNNFINVFNFFQNHERWIPEVETGSFIVFPCWVPHHTIPNSNPNQKRLTITANLSIHPKTGEVPNQ